MSAQSAAQTPQAAAATTTSLLDDIVEKSKIAKSTVEHQRAKDIITELVTQVMDGTVVVSANLAATIDARVAELDQLISDQLSAVMHAHRPGLQQLDTCREHPIACAVRHRAPRIARCEPRDDHLITPVEVVNERRR